MSEIAKVKQLPSKCVEFLRWENLKKIEITLEPVFLLFCINLGLIMITSQGLYINKTCRVNLGHNDTICDNIHSHSDIQMETQKYVSEIQARTALKA